MFFSRRHVFICCQAAVASVNLVTQSGGGTDIEVSCVGMVGGGTDIDGSNKGVMVG